VVTSRFGPEAGVWVIAKTKDLGTRYAKIVVTDEAGRYVIPDLPKAKYRLWVRGNGLVDSPKVAAEPGRRIDLDAVVAPSLAAAAQYYPPIYWLALPQHADRHRQPIRFAPCARERKLCGAQGPLSAGLLCDGVDGRIDDPAGWKGRGLWATTGARAPFHIESADAPAPGAPGKTPEAYASPLVVNFQLRPDPLAH
jgi:hypothetical protein